MFWEQHGYLTNTDKQISFTINNQLVDTIHLSLQYIFSLHITHVLIYLHELFSVYIQSGHGSI